MWTYTELNPSLIPNTVMRKGIDDDGIHKTYRITPVDGYVLHDKNFDDIVLDDEGNETGEVIPGYRTSTASCGANYDFNANPREFYAVLASSVPENQIFGTVNPPETE